MVVPQEIYLEAVASQLISCIAGVDIEEASAAASVAETLHQCVETFKRIPESWEVDLQKYLDEIPH